MTIVNTLLSYLKSRTVITVIVLVVINGFPAVRELIPMEWLAYIVIALGALAIRFRVKPKATF